MVSLEHTLSDFIRILPTPVYTIFECHNGRMPGIWPVKHSTVLLTPENMVHMMMSSKRNWSTIHQLVREILTNKEKEERERQATSRTPNPRDLRGTGDVSENR